MFQLLSQSTQQVSSDAMWAVIYSLGLMVFFIALLLIATTRR